MKILPIALSAALVLPAFSGVVSANQTAPVSVASNVDKAVRTNELNILGYYDMKLLGIKVDYANKKLVTTYASNEWAHPKYDSTYYTVKVTGLDGTVKANVSVNGKETSTKAGNVLNNLAIAEGDLISIVHVEAGTRFRVAGNVENLPAGQALTRTSNFYVVGDTLEYSNENKAELQGKLKATLETANTYKADKYNTKGFAALQASIAKGNSTLKSGTNKALKEVTAEINQNISKLKDKNFININGVYEIQTLSFTVDYANKKLVVLNSYGVAHPGYGNNFYYSIKVTGADGTVKANVSLKGNEESSKAAKALNNLAIEEGDVISITHDEAFYRLILKGAIKNQTPNQPATRTTNLEIGNDELIRK